MKRLPHSLLVVFALGLLPVTAWPAVLSFEDLPAFAGSDPPGTNSFNQLSAFNGGSAIYGGVTWGQEWWVAGRGLIPHPDPSDMFSSGSTEPFAHQRPGNYAAFTAFGGYGEFETPNCLTGVWFSRARLPEEHDPGIATNVTVSALSGTNVLASVSLDLKNTTPVFMDTSAFLLLRGITRYRVEGHGADGPNDAFVGGAFFVADDFQFAAASLAELCPCDGSRRAHAQYIRCLHRAVVELVREEALTRRQARHLLRHALRTPCDHRHDHSR